MKLRYQKNKYGPYADNLNHVLQRMEGHFINGYGDRTQEAEISLSQGAGEKARVRLIEEKEANQRLNRVKELITGFETPYGMELLVTVHYIMKQNPQKKGDVDFITEQVRDWTERKRELFTPRHIKKVWKHLSDFETQKYSDSNNTISS